MVENSNVVEINSSLISEIRVPVERRDMSAQLRHREYGKLMMNDIDNLEDEHCNPWLEIDGAKPIAIVDYKLPNEKIDLYRMNGLKNLADAANIPAFISIYFKETHSYYIYPLNHIAYIKLDNILKPVSDKFREFYKLEPASKTTPTGIYCERLYVWFLYQLRGLEISNDSLNKFSKEYPSNYNTYKPNIVRLANGTYPDK